MVSQIVKIKHHNQNDKSIFYFKRRSVHVFSDHFQALMMKKQGAGITIREAQLVTMVMFKLMTILLLFISFSMDSAKMLITVNVWDASI